jgi:hypothetical protein
MLLEEHDGFILNACSIPMLVHYNLVLLAIEKHFFTVLAAFIEAVQRSPSTVLDCIRTRKDIGLIKTYEELLKCHLLKFKKKFMQSSTKKTGIQT